MFCSKLRKYLAIMLMITQIFFYATPYSYAQVFSSQNVANSNPSNQSTFKNLEINKDFGEIVEHFEGNKPQKVICIEDLHCDPFVQKNISDILQTIKKTYGEKFKFIGIEGSYGLVDVRILSKIPDEKIKEELTNKYLAQGYISGAELYSIKYDPDILIYGVEDEGLYKKDFNLLVNSFDFYKKWKNIFRKIKRDLEDAEKVLYTDELKDFQSEISKDESGKISLENHIEYLINLAKHNDIKLNQKYPNILNYSKMNELNNEIQVDALDTELGFLLKALNPYLDKQEIKYLLELKAQKDKENFRHYIYTLIKNKNVLLDRTYKETDKYIRYLDREKDFDKIMFLEEKENLEFELKLSLTREQKDVKSLIECKHYLNIMDLYFNNNVSSNDAKEWRIGKQILFRNMDRFGDLLGRKNDFKKNKLLLQEIDDNMNDFYKTADKRNESILANFFQNSENSQVKVAIFGGYHTTGMLDFLRSMGISFDVVRPNVSQKYNKNLYFRRVNEEYNLFNKKFFVNDVVGKNSAKVQDIIKNTLMVISGFQTEEFNQEIFDAAISRVFEDFERELNYEMPLSPEEEIDATAEKLPTLRMTDGSEDSTLYEGQWEEVDQSKEGGTKKQLKLTLTTPTGDKHFRVKVLKDIKTSYEAVAYFRMKNMDIIKHFPMRFEIFDMKGNICKSEEEIERARQNGGVYLVIQDFKDEMKGIKGALDLKITGLTTGDIYDSEEVVAHSGGKKKKFFSKVWMKITTKLATDKWKRLGFHTSQGKGLVDKAKGYLNTAKTTRAFFMERMHGETVAEHIARIKDARESLKSMITSFQSSACAFIGTSVFFIKDQNGKLVPKLLDPAHTVFEDEANKIFENKEERYRELKENFLTGLQDLDRFIAEIEIELAKNGALEEEQVSTKPKVVEISDTEMLERKRIEYEQKMEEMKVSISQYVDVELPTDLLEFINEYIKNTGKNLENGIIWSGKINGEDFEIYSEASSVKIRKKAIVRSYIVVRDRQGGVSKRKTLSELERDFVMMDQYIDEIAELSAANEAIIGFRPINRDSTNAFRRGAVGKGMEVKGKSSPYGKNLAGKVPFSQKWSKLFGQKDVIEEYDLKNRETLEHYANVDIVALTDSQGDEISGIVDADGNPVMNEKGEMIFVTRRKDGFLYLEETDSVYHLKAGENLETIKVMGYKNAAGLVAPCVADYDQLCFGVRVDKTNERANLDLVTQTEESKARGIMTDSGYTATIALDIITEKSNAISHGQETSNPYPERFISFKEKSEDGYLFFVPYYENGVLQKNVSEMRMLKNEQEVMDLYNEFLKKGYQMPVNPKWSWVKNEKGEYEKYKYRIVDRKLHMADKKIKNSTDKRIRRSYRKIKEMTQIMDEINKMNLEGKLSEVKVLEVKLFQKEQEYFNMYKIESPTVIAREDKELYLSEMNSLIQNVTMAVGLLCQNIMSQTILPILGLFQVQARQIEQESMVSIAAERQELGFQEMPPRLVEFVSSFIGIENITVDMAQLTQKIYEKTKEYLTIFRENLDDNWELVASDEYADRAELLTKSVGEKNTIYITKGMRKLLNNMSKILTVEKYLELVNQIIEHERLELEYIKQGKTEAEAHKLALADAGELQKMFGENIKVMMDLMRAEDSFSTREKQEETWTKLEQVKTMIAKMRGVSIDQVSMTEVLDLFPNVKNEYGRNLVSSGEKQELESEVIVSLADCKGEDIMTYLARLGLVENGNIKQGLKIVLVHDIANPEDTAAFLKAVKVIQDLYKKSSGRISLVIGANGFEILKENDERTAAIKNLIFTNIAKVAHKTLDGRFITSTGFVSIETLAALKASEGAVNENVVANILNTVFKFSVNMDDMFGASFSRGLDSELGVDETFEQRIEIFNKKLDAIDGGRTKFLQLGIDASAAVRLLSMKRFIYGKTGLLNMREDTYQELFNKSEYSWFRQLPFGLDVDLPETEKVVSKDLVEQHNGSRVNLTTLTNTGRVISTEISIQDEGTQTILDVRLQKPPVTELVGLDRASVTKIKAQLMVEKIFNKILETTGLKHLLKVLEKDKTEVKRTIENYKDVAAAA